MIAFAQGADCVERQADGPPYPLFPTSKPNPPVHFSKAQSPARRRRRYVTVTRRRLRYVTVAVIGLTRGELRELKALRIMHRRAKLVLAAEARHSAGDSWPQIGPRLGIHWNTLFQWHQAYLKQGLDGLLPRFSTGRPRSSSRPTPARKATGSPATPPPISGNPQPVPRLPRQIASVARPVADEVATANRAPIEARAWQPACRRAA